MHREQKQFCKKVKRLFPAKFRNVTVLDVGSLDINGNNRYLFRKYKYLGIDLGPGKNVDYVASGHEFTSPQKFDVVITTEALEHDDNWRKTIVNCIHLTKPGGIFLLTCASIGREEHGTYDHHEWCSPHTKSYYKNLSLEEVSQLMNAGRHFSTYYFEYNPKSKDLYFFGIRKPTPTAREIYQSLLKKETA